MTRSPVLTFPSAGRTLARPGDARARRRARAWRRRGRRAQVAAVATILGLLLVVTFIATYLSTTLPNQMQVNDLNHDLQVENQLGQLSAALQAATGVGAIGAQISQPITLGSAGAPPFAGQDSAYTSALPQGSGISVQYTVLGQLAYFPPPGYPAGGSATGCTAAATTLTCSTAGYSPHLNMSANATVYTLTFSSSGFAALNVSTNSSTISLSASGSQTLYLQLIGNSNTLAVTDSSTGAEAIALFGNHDAVTLASTGSGLNVFYVYGSFDTITVSQHTSTGGMRVVVYGANDKVVFPAVTSTPVLAVYLTGFNATNPVSSLCPYANLSSTDSVTGFSSTTATLKETLNNSVGYYNNQTAGTGWTVTYQNVPRTTCPYFATAHVNVKAGGVPGAAFAVHLRNTYAPVAEVAFDQGAIVYVQTGGTPTMYEAPLLQLKELNTTHGSTTYHNITQATLWIPEFLGQIPGESGVLTADFSFRLLGVQTVAVSNTTGLATSTPVVFTITTPYAGAWLQFINAHNWPFTATCAPVFPATSTACTGPYSDSTGLATVSFSIASSGLSLLSIETASFAVSLI